MNLRDYLTGLGQSFVNTAAGHAAQDQASGNYSRAQAPNARHIHTPNLTVATTGDTSRLHGVAPEDHTLITLESGEAASLHNTGARQETPASVQLLKSLLDVRFQMKKLNPLNPAYRQLARQANGLETQYVAARAMNPAPVDEQDFPFVFTAVRQAADQLADAFKHQQSLNLILSQRPDQTLQSLQSLSADQLEVLHAACTE